jgi:hypothetical protein
LPFCPHPPIWLITLIGELLVLLPQVDQTDREIRRLLAMNWLRQWPPGTSALPPTDDAPPRQFDEEIDTQLVVENKTQHTNVKFHQNTANC